MSLMHTPAHTVDYPDRFTDEETGREYTVRQDVNVEDPREGVDPEYAALWAYRQPRLHSSVVAIKPEGNEVIDAFEHFFEELDDDVALESTLRWIRVFRPDLGDRYQLETRTIRGYSQGDWLDVIAVVDRDHGTPESHLTQLRQWAFGDVWAVIPDGPGSAVGGIYADDAESAVTHFRENFEDEVTAVTLEVDLLTADPDRVDAVVEKLLVDLREDHAVANARRAEASDEET